MESNPFTLARPAIAFCDAFAPAPALSDAMVLSAFGINCRACSLLALDAARELLAGSSCLLTLNENLFVIMNMQRAQLTEQIRTA